MGRNFLGVVPALKASLAQLELSSSAMAPVGSVVALAALSQVRAGVHKEAFFSEISPLGAHLDKEVKDKIWENKHIGIWSLISVNQCMVDKERCFFSDKLADRKPKVD